MNNVHTSLTWIGAGILYVLLVWGMVSGYRHHINTSRDDHMSLDQIAVFLIYFLVVVLSVGQESVVFEVITNP